MLDLQEEGRALSQARDEDAKVCLHLKKEYELAEAEQREWRQHQQQEAQQHFEQEELEEKMQMESRARCTQLPHRDRCPKSSGRRSASTHHHGTLPA